MKRETKELLKKRADDACRERDASNVAIHCLLNNEVKWLKDKAGFGVSLGLCRLTASHGGVVMHVVKGSSKYATTHYLEPWADWIIRHHRGSDSRESQELYMLAIEAKDEQRKAFEENGPAIAA